MKNQLPKDATMLESQPAVLAPVEPPVRPRLWVVRVVREAYVLATDKEAALSAKRDIERWEDSPRVTAEPAEGQRLEGWDDTPSLCLVYGTKDDISLETARRLYSGA